MVSNCSLTNFLAKLGDSGLHFSVHFQNVIDSQGGQERALPPRTCEPNVSCTTATACRGPPKLRSRTAARARTRALSLPPALTGAPLPQEQLWGFWETWGHGHRERNRVSSDPLWRLQATWSSVHRDQVSSGPAVRSSAGRGAASRGTGAPDSSGPAMKALRGRGAAFTLTGALPTQDQLWGIREDVGPPPHGQEPGLLRTRLGRSR